MEITTILLIAIGLAMDAFSVCISAGIQIPKPDAGHYFRLAFHFGLFQFFMPILGYCSGTLIQDLVREFDHWVAFGLLSFVGLKMIRESFSKDKEQRESRDPSRGFTLVFLSLATSIDAAAVGFTFAMLNNPILFPSVVIGVVCALFSVAGILIGRKLGELTGPWIERLGGLLLIAMGSKILCDHLWP